MEVQIKPEQRLDRFSTFGEEISKESWVTHLLHDFTQPNLLNLGGGQPPRIKRVDDLIKEAEKKAIEEVTSKVHAYGKIRGWEPFLDAFANRYNDWYKKQTGEDLGLDSAKHIIVGPSSSSNNLLLVHSFCGPNETTGEKYKAVGFVPTYVGLEPQFPLGSKKTFLALFQKMKIDENDGTFEFVPDVETLEGALDIPEVNMFYIARPNNPDGAVMEQKPFEKTIESTRRKGVKVIEDCAYAGPDPNYVYGGTTCLPVFAENTIIGHSHSKFGQAGDRVGEFISKNEELMNRLERACAHAFFHAQQPTQAYTERLIQKQVTQSEQSPIKESMVQQAVLTDLMETNALTEIDRIYHDFFTKSIQVVIDTIRKECTSFAEHKHFICVPKGAFYIYNYALFPKDITSVTLYTDLRDKEGVGSVPGPGFVFGDDRFAPKPEILGYDPSKLALRTWRISAVESMESTSEYPEGRLKAGTLKMCKVIDGYNGFKR